MTPAQCRAARALIDMTQADLARAAVVPLSIIADFEAGVSEPRYVEVIRQALERAGVEFIDGSRPGVRFRKAR
jgi:predicted transcriptional regulator